MAARRRRADTDDEAEAQADLGEVRVRDRGAVRGLSGAVGTGNETVALARRVWARFNAGGDFWALIDPDCLLVTDPRWPGGGEFRGQAEFRRFMAQFLEAFAGIRFKEEREPQALGDSALFQGRWVGEGASSGIETASVPFWVVHRSRNGLITESRFFFDESEAREAASPT